MDFFGIALHRYWRGEDVVLYVERDDGFVEELGISKCFSEPRE